jgi:hypothetical protein
VSRRTGSNRHPATIGDERFGRMPVEEPKVRAIHYPTLRIAETTPEKLEALPPVNRVWNRDNQKRARVRNQTQPAEHMLRLLKVLENVAADNGVEWRLNACPVDPLDVLGYDIVQDAPRAFGFRE